MAFDSEQTGSTTPSFQSENPSVSVTSVSSCGLTSAFGFTGGLELSRVGQYGAFLPGGWKPALYVRQGCLTLRPLTATVDRARFLVEPSNRNRDAASVQQILQRHHAKSFFLHSRLVRIAHQFDHPERLNPPAITVGTFKQEVRREFTAADGLPANAATCVAVLDAKTVLAGTTNGLARFADGRWTAVKGTAGASVEAVAASKDKVLLVMNGRLLSLQGDKLNLIASLPSGVKANTISIGETIYLATDQGLFETTGSTLKPVAALNDALGENQAVFQIAIGPRVVVGAAAGLFQKQANGQWTRLFPADKTGRSWAPINVRGVAYDTQGRLWFASPQGVGRLDQGVDAVHRRGRFALQ